MIRTTPGALTSATPLEGVPDGVIITARLVDGHETLPSVVTVAAILDAAGDPLNARSATFIAPALLPVELEWLDGAVVVDSELVVAGIDIAEPFALCTLGDVRARRQTKLGMTDQDALVEQLIASVSAAIAEEYEREFTPTDGLTRTFEYDHAEGGLLSLTPFDLRAVTQMRTNPDADMATTLAAGDYRLHPHPSKYGTFSAVAFQPGLVIRSTTWGRALVEITGNWGFEAVPHNVREAAIVSVVHNMRTSVGQYSVADGAGGETRYERAEIPQAAHDLLEPFRRMA